MTKSRAKNTLSVVIPVWNVKDIIVDCLDSVKWATEIIIVDMGSTDGTIELCKKYPNVRLMNVTPEDDNFDKNRKLGMVSATSDWILKLDSDERLTSELQEEIIELLKNDKINDLNGYRLLNKIYFSGFEIKHGFVKRPSSELRLIKNKSWTYNPDRFHSQIYVEGQEGILKNCYLHYNNRSVSEFLSKTNKYTSYDSRKLFYSGTRYSIIEVLIAPIKSFIKLYFVQFGILDGKIGVVVCALYSLYNFFEKLKVYELQLQASHEHRRS